MSLNSSQLTIIVIGILRSCGNCYGIISFSF